MIRTLLTGASGTLGSALRSRLVASGHVVRAASRSPPEETTGDIEWVTLALVEQVGIEAAVEDVDIVIHAATAPQGNTKAVDVEGTRRLLEAAETAGVKNFIYPSIVGIDDIPFTYYQHKRTAEIAVENSDVPTTIIRATQFHSFVAELLGYVSKLPVWPLPTQMQVQPVDVRDVADVIVDHATVTAAGRTEPIGGPEVRSVGHLARTYRATRELGRPIIRFPLPGGTAAAFRAGHATCPEQRIGTITWRKWLAEQYGSQADESNSRIQSLT